MRPGRGRRVAGFGREARGRPVHFFWRFVFPAVVALSGVVVAFLVLESARTIVGGTIGQVDDSIVTDPEAPGYLAFVSPTPTRLLLHTHDGSLTGVTFLAKARSSGGGSLLLFPPDLLVGADAGFGHAPTGLEASEIAVGPLEDEAHDLSGPREADGGVAAGIGVGGTGIWEEASGYAPSEPRGVDAGSVGAGDVPDAGVVPGAGSADAGAVPAATLGEAYVAGGASEVERLLEGLFGFGFVTIEVSQSELASAMKPIGSLSYQLTDDLVVLEAGGAAQAVYPSGVLELDAAAAADVYGFQNPGEAGGRRLERQRNMWEAWLQAISRSQIAEGSLGPQGWEDAGLAAFLAGLGAGGVVVEAVPLRSVAPPAIPPAAGTDAEPADSGQTRTLYTLGIGPAPGGADDAAGGTGGGLTADRGSAVDGRAWLRSRLRVLVPWPRTPKSFLRPTVQMLDGIGDPEVRNARAQDVIDAGGVVTVIGNDAAFGRAETLVAYHRPEVKATAEAIAIILRPGGRSAGMAYVQVPDNEEDFADITVTVGLDLIEE